MPLSSTQGPGVRPLPSHLLFIYFFTLIFLEQPYAHNKIEREVQSSRIRGPPPPCSTTPTGVAHLCHWGTHTGTPSSSQVHRLHQSSLALGAVHSMGLDECVIITTFVCFCGIVQRNFTVWPLFHIRNERLEGSSGSQWTRHSARAIAPQQFNLWETWPFLPDLLFLLTNRLNLFFFEKLPRAVRV